MYQLTYNTLVAHGAGPKAALVFGYLNQISQYSMSETHHVRFYDVIEFSGLTDHEVRTALKRLEVLNAFQKLTLNKYDAEFSGLSLQGVFEAVKRQGLDQHTMMLGLVEELVIDQNIFKMFSNTPSLNINAAILLGVLLSFVHRTSLVQAQDASDWFTANYQLWHELSGLSIARIKVAKDMLKLIGVLESRSAGKPIVHEHRVRFDKLSQHVMAFVEHNDQMSFEHLNAS